jgi:CheY-like chemotaxis protein
MEVCLGPNAGREILDSERFDAVIVDCDDLQDGLDVLKHSRLGAANRRSVSLAVLNGKTSMRQAFDLGASFVLQKPVTLVNAVRCASAAVSMMARERRRYYRHAIDMTVTLVFGDDLRLEAKATNVSDGGLAVELKRPLPKKGLALVKFTLPGMASAFELKAEIAWADEKGRIGVRFVDIPKKIHEQLETWLAENFAAKFPELSTMAETAPAQTAPPVSMGTSRPGSTMRPASKPSGSRTGPTKPLRARA